MIWRACERMNIRPPGVLDRWDDMSVGMQAELIAYCQIREYEDAERAQL